MADAPDHVWNHPVDRDGGAGAPALRERQCCRCGLTQRVYRDRDNVWTEFWKAGARLDGADKGRVPVPECVAIAAGWAVAA